MLRKALLTTALSVGAVAVICVLISPFHQTLGDLFKDGDGDVDNYYLSLRTTITATAAQPEGYSSFPLGDRDGAENVDESGRALFTAGVPGEGLLFAVANSDEDVVAWDGVESTEEGGQEQGGSNRHSRHWHKVLQPLNK